MFPLNSISTVLGIIVTVAIIYYLFDQWFSNNNDDGKDSDSEKNNQ
jgi:hypothetical protein